MGLPKGKTNNPNGRLKGSKNERTKQWEVLAESIVGEHADGFNNLMRDLYLNAKAGDKFAYELYTRNYLQAVEYFKPKQARVTHAGDKDAPPIQIVVSGETWGKL